MHAEEDDGQSFFIPETGNAFAAPSQPKSSFGSGFNPEAPTFTMTKNFGENPNSPIAKVFGEKATPQFGSKLGETAPSFSTKFGESTAATAPKFSFGEPGSSGISGASSASPKTFASTPSANAQTLNTPSQDNSSGPSARSSFGVNSPFTVSGPPTTSQGDHPTSSFTGFNFAKPAQPPTSNSPLPSNAFQSNKASEPASARPPAVEPPTSTSFKFPSSTSAASSQALQAPLPAFSAPAPSKGSCHQALNQLQLTRIRAIHICIYTPISKFHFRSGCRACNSPSGTGVWNNRAKAIVQDTYLFCRTEASIQLCAEILTPATRIANFSEDNTDTHQRSTAATISSTSPSSRSRQTIHTILQLHALSESACWTGSTANSISTTNFK